MTKQTVDISSGNIFADIGLPHPEEHLLKAQLVVKITHLMTTNKMKQREAAELFGITQPDVSKMLRGHFHQFSVERLMRFLVALDQTVEIVVRPRRRSEAASLRVV
jgi:predicted XRE-type DNA-binding protein